MKKILFLAHHRLNRAPGQRYRFEQFFNYLNQNNLNCELAHLLSEKDDIIMYQKGNYFKKFLIGFKAYFKRFLKILRVREYDLIVIFREVIPTRSIFFEKIVSKLDIPIIYDFDDAIWIKDVSYVNKKISFLKDEKKIEKIIPLCKHITCGNDYLANFASKYSSNITIIPSTVDTDYYKPIEKQKKYGKVKIGWVGSHTTVKHFEMITNVYLKLKSKYQSKIDFVLIGDENYFHEKLGINGLKWENKMEVELFNSFDIGIMPLPDNEWAKGKCGMKGLLYMSVGIPSVMSNVGMNKDIIEHGENGFLPVGEKQWVEVLSKLIENKELRKKIGDKGRETVLGKYSKNKIKKTYLDLYTSLMK